MKWTEITPQEADEYGIRLPHPDIDGPVNEMGLECPWPWDPPQLAGAPLGQYHCPYCGGMCIAGVDHFDNRGYDGMGDWGLGPGKPYWMEPEAYPPVEN